VDFPLPPPPPDAAIRPGEDAISLDAVEMMRQPLAQDAPAAVAVFEAFVGMLTGTGNQDPERIAPDPVRYCAVD